MEHQPLARRTFIGVSTKMYLGYVQSLDWLHAMSAELSRFADSTSNTGTGVTAFVAPSFPVLESASRILSGTPAVLAAQNCSAQDGPVTGEVGPGMLAELGVGIVEIGHAERRRMFGETDELIAQKVDAALAVGLTPLLCIGESVRTGPLAAADFCHGQVTAALGGGPVSAVLLAYEPVWAIGAAEPAPVDYINAVIDELRALLALQAPPLHEGESAEPGALTGFHSAIHILYGGSAGPGLLPRLPSADGLFLGRFAHDPRNFGIVLEEAHALSRGEDAAR